MPCSIPKYVRIYGDPPETELNKKNEKKILTFLFVFTSSNLGLVPYPQILTTVSDQIFEYFACIQVNFCIFFLQFASVVLIFFSKFRTTFFQCVFFKRNAPFFLVWHFENFSIFQQKTFLFSKLRI